MAFASIITPLMASVFKKLLGRATSVSSFDVFDTLIARSTWEPEDVFSLVEQEFPFADFRSRRRHAQQCSNGTLNDTYVQFGKIFGVDAETCDRLKSLELEIERRVSVPIRAIMNVVKDGDLLLSDMYLPPEKIRWLLEKHGFNKQVTIYVSPAGKSSGESYRKFLKRYVIKKHYGDNVHSDINMSAQHGIEPVHVTLSQFSPSEQFLLQYHAPNAAFLIRQFRLAAPRLDHRLWEEQAKYNALLLLYVAFRVKLILETEQLDSVYFITRDGCFLQPLFAQLFPAVKQNVLHSSRIMHRGPTPGYIEYLRHNYDPKRSLIVDLHGNFASGRQLYRELFGALPRVHVIFPGLGDGFAGLTYEFGGIVTNQWETLNYDEVGTLVDYDPELGPIRAPNENDTAKCHEMREAFLEFLKILQGFSTGTLRHELLCIPPEAWMTFVYFALQSTQQPQLLGGPSGELLSLRELANNYHSEKGDSYRCAHNYALHYQKIFHRLIERFGERVKLLQIGLNPDEAGSVPSLQAFSDYFSHKIDLVGFDINPQYAKFAAPGRKIVIGDQASRDSLQQLTKDTYHIVIDDGYRMSKHQQVGLSELWITVHPGGCYVIEDLHYQPDPETGIKTRDLLLGWSRGDLIDSQHVQAGEIVSSLDRIEFYDSASKLWDRNLLQGAFAVIWKKN